MPVNDFRWVEDISEFDESFIKIFKLHNRKIISHFHLKEWKLKRSNLYDKIGYDIQIKNLKQSLNQGLVWKKVHRVIKVNQTAWLKPSIDKCQEKKKKMTLRNTFKVDY